MYIAKKLLTAIKEKDLYSLLKVYFKFVYILEQNGHKHARKTRRYRKIVNIIKAQKKKPTRIDELIKNLFDK